MWLKQGQVLATDRYAQLPVVDGPWLYYSSRDARNRSRIFRRPLLGGDEQLVLDLGPPGDFDDAGVMPACIAKPEGGQKTYLYYTAWNLRQDRLYHHSIGLAIDTGDGFRKLPGPILDRTLHDPYVLNSPFVLKGNNFWHMWYVAGTGWVPYGDRLVPTYCIKYACAADGVHWQRPGWVCVGQRSPEEAISRPWVVQAGGLFHMWYSYLVVGVQKRYLIGYARSQDGQTWERRDDLAGIEPGPASWDSEMVCYPCVLKDGDHWLMYYNGNNYGQTGIGVALAGELPT